MCGCGNVAVVGQAKPHLLEGIWLGFSPLHADIDIRSLDVGRCSETSGPPE